MSDASRRGFLVGAIGSAAVVGTASFATAAEAASPKEKNYKGTKVDGSLVAYVQDAKSGRVSILVDGREVVVHDHTLVAHLTSKLS
jgi:hypothetical protein